MEADSKIKRGRPNVYARTFGKDGESMKEFNKNLFPSDGERSIANMVYVIDGQGISDTVCNARSTFYTPHGRSKGQAILEQIGRMHLQDGYSEEACKEALKVALNLWKQGFKVKDIERYIRNVRKTGEL